MAGLLKVSVIPNSQENANFARIACLLLREGTERMKAVTLANLPPRQTLQQALEASKTTFTCLMKNGIVSEKHHELLFPAQGDIRIDDIDMTLWVTLHAISHRNVIGSKNIGGNHLKLRKHLGSMTLSA